jgi:NTE family protein
VAFSPLGSLAASARATLRARTTAMVLDADEPADTVFVLSGGAALGAAQVGMLAVLAEAGIVPDLLIGCSAGAINAAFFAMEPSTEGADQLADVWRGLSTAQVFGKGRHVLFNMLRGRTGLSSPDGLRGIIRSQLGYRWIQDAPTRLGIVTTHLDSGTTVVHRSGEVEDILLASAAIPGVFPPVELTLAHSVDYPGAHVDGGVTSLVPASSALPYTPSQVWVLDVAGAAKGTGTYHPGSLDPVATGFALALTTQEDVPTAGTDGPRVDVVSLPMTSAQRLRSVMDFSRTDALIEAGRLAAEETLASTIWH